MRRHVITQRWAVLVQVPFEALSGRALRAHHQRPLGEVRTADSQQLSWAGRRQRIQSKAALLEQRLAICLPPAAPTVRGLLSDL